MFLSKSIKYPLVLALLFSYALSGNIPAKYNSVKVSPEEKIQSGMLPEGKGIIENASEICSGGAFQFNVFKLKNSFGTDTSFFIKQNSGRSVISYLSDAFHKDPKIPRYLYFHNIQI